MSSLSGTPVREGAFVAGPRPAPSFGAPSVLGEAVAHDAPSVGQSQTVAGSGCQPHGHLGGVGCRIAAPGQAPVGASVPEQMANVASTVEVVRQRRPRSLKSSLSQVRSKGSSGSRVSLKLSPWPVTDQTRQSCTCGCLNALARSTTLWSHSV